MAKKSNVVALREADHTPALILNRTMAKLGDIAQVVVLIHWTDDRGWGCDWSAMTPTEMAMAKAVLGHRLSLFMDEMFIEGPGVAGPTPGHDHAIHNKAHDGTGAASQGSATGLPERTNGGEDQGDGPDPTPRHPGGAAA